MPKIRKDQCNACRINNHQFISFDGKMSTSVGLETWLEDVVAATSAICGVDGQAGWLGRAPGPIRWLLKRWRRC